MLRLGLILSFRLARLFLLFIAQAEGEDLAATMLVQIDSAEDHYSVGMFAGNHRDHAVFPAAERNLTESGQGFPLIQIDIVNANVVHCDTTGVLVDSIIAASIDD